LLAVKDPDPSVAALIGRLESWHDLSLGVYLVDNYFEQWLPRFFYFSDYSTMRGRVSLPDLKTKEAAGLTDEADQTFLSLLRTVDADLSDFEGCFQLLAAESGPPGRHPDVSGESSGGTAAEPRPDRQSADL